MWRFLFIGFLIAHAMVHVGLGASLGLMVLYFNPWFLFIEGVDVALFVGIVWLTWPSKTMVGA